MTPQNKNQSKIDPKRSASGLWTILRISSLTVAGLAFLYEHSNVGWNIRDLLLSPWTSYDTEYYIQIVRVGYRTGDITSGFHPLYPLIAKIPNAFIHNPVFSLMLISSIASILLTISFCRLAALDYDTHTVWTAAALFLCWPITICIFAAYTEALFLFLAILCLFKARKGNFWYAGLAGGLASLTRQHGIFLAAPLAWEIWESTNREWYLLLRLWRKWLAIALIPGGYALWVAYRAFAISDVRPDFSTPQHFIYSVMISPTHYHVFAAQQFLPPWIALFKALQILWSGNVHWSAYGDALLGLIFLSMLVFGWRHLRISYRIYSLIIILVALSYHTGATVNPYTSLPRHMLLAFPVFMGVAASYKFRRLNFVLVVLGLCQELFLCCFVWRTWVL